MPEYLAPGVYIEEIEIGAKPIEGVSTSTAAFIGIAEKGPLNNPILITNIGDYNRIFGGYIKESYLTYSISGFFSNGGKRCFVVRVADLDTVSSAHNVFKDGNQNEIIKILASSPGSWGKNITAEIVQSSLGSNCLYTSSLAENAEAEQNFIIPKSVKGISIGDTIRIWDRENNFSDDLTVQGFEKLNANTKVLFSANIGKNFLIENTMVIAVLTAGDGVNSASLGSANGFSKGSLVSIMQPSQDPVYMKLTDVKLSENKIYWEGKFKKEDGTSVATALGAYLLDIKRVKLNFTILGQLESGATTISLADIDDDGTGAKEIIRPGDMITFGSGDPSETVQVNYGWNPGTDIEFTPAVKNTYAVRSKMTSLSAPQTLIFTTPKKDVQIDLQDLKTLTFQVTGFKAGDFLSFIDNSGNVLTKIEIEKIDADNPNTIVLKDALQQGQWDGTEKVNAVLNKSQTEIMVTTTQGFQAKDLVEVKSDTAGKTLIMRLKEINGNRFVFESNPVWNTNNITDAKFVGKIWEKSVAKTLEFKIAATYEKGKEIVVEAFDKLSLDPASDRYFGKEGIIKNTSTLIDVDDLRTTKKAPDSIAELPVSIIAPLNKEGNDGIQNIEVGDYIGSIINDKRTGMMALELVDEVNILCIPDIMKSFGGGNGSLSPDDVELAQLAMISHCENMKDRFAILDSIGKYTVQEIQTWRNDNLDSKYAALYYPWIQVLDPIKADNSNTRMIPPSGYIAGIFARSDTERGVHKAPANEIIRGVVDLERKISTGEQEILNPDGINCIRAFPGRGIRVWGARTISSDSLWKYVNVRRLFLYLEESIEEGTQWVVFEPNDEKLWARVKQTISQFLTRVWRDGALMGTKAEEAFFVKCDRSTMTQDDIDNGRLIVLIGVAPVKPAEFVIFRIAQWTGGSAVTE